MLSKEQKRILIIAIIIIISGIIITFFNHHFQPITADYTLFQPPSMHQQTPSKNNQIIMIHIAGAIKKPGVYQIQKDKRLLDAVMMAGGPSVKADLNKVNLASKLLDEQKITIPFQQDIRKLSQTTSTKVNLNTATKKQLETIPGIGPSTAKRIIQYRNKNGQFQSINSIEKVKGIGKKKSTKLISYLTI